MTRIGRGSFGEVYKAINVESNELVGVKLVTLISNNIKGTSRCCYAST